MYLPKLEKDCRLVAKTSFDRESVVPLAKNIIFEEEILVGISFFTTYLRSSFGWSKSLNNNSSVPASARLSGIKLPLLSAIFATGAVNLSAASLTAAATKESLKEGFFELFIKFLEQTISAMEAIFKCSFVVEEEWMVEDK